MKKVLILFIFCLMFISKINAKEVEIDSIKVTSKSETIEVGEVSIENNNIMSDITFENIGEYVTFELKIKEIDDLYRIKNITDNNKINNLKITYEYKDNKNILMTIKYEKELYDNIELNDLNIVIELEKITNPKTNDNRVLAFGLILLILILSVLNLLKGYNTKFTGINILLILLFPIIINASITVKINIIFKMNTIKIIPSTAMFKPGSEVNIFMKTLAGYDEPETTTKDTHIYSILRSEMIDEKYKNDDYIVSTENSNKPIYMWYIKDEENEEIGNIYYYTQANKIFLNEDSSYMFGYLTKAINLDISDFDTSLVTNMKSLFENMNSIKEIDVSNFDTSNVTSMSLMFGHMTNLEYVDLSHFNTSKVTTFNELFVNDKKINNIDVSNFDTSSVTNMYKTFRDCPSLESLDLLKWDTSKVTTMVHMFSGNIKLSSMDLSNFNTSNVKSMYAMFNGDKNINNYHINNFDTSNVTDFGGMFKGISDEVLDISNFDTSNATNMENFFRECPNLKTVYVSDKFDTSKVTKSTYIFTGSSKLVGGNGTKYSSSALKFAQIDTPLSPGYFTFKYNEKFNYSFAEDDLRTSILCLKDESLCNYKIGDTKSIELSNFGTQMIRISNISNPNECKNDDFSQTSCGVVLEFVDAITKNVFNENDTNVGGFKDSYIRNYLNDDIYSSLPSELKNSIISTKVVSSHGTTEGENNFITEDKLYLLSPKEVFGNDIEENSYSFSYDTSNDFVRQLDYYSNNNVSLIDNIDYVSKKYEDSVIDWWLRSTWKNNKYFLVVHKNKHPYYVFPTRSYGLSPAFRIR